MLTRTLLTLALTLSLGLSSSSVFAVYQDHVKISNVLFHNIDGSNLEDSGLFYSTLGLEKNSSYSKEYIAERMEKLDEMLDYRVVKWNCGNNILDVTLSKKKVVGAVEIQGNGTFSSSDIMDEVGFKVIGSFCEDVCDTLVQKIKKYYADQGFYKADVVYNQEPVEGDRVKVVVKVKEDVPTVVSDVVVAVDGYVDPNKVRDILDVKKGDRVNYSKINLNLKDVRLYLFSNEYYASTIDKSSVSVDDKMASASINVGIKTGPRFNILFKGNNTFANVQTLKTALDITEADVVSKDYYTVLVRKLEDFYKSRGFADVKISTEEELGLKEGELTLLFNINEGARKYFRSVNFTFKSGRVDTYELKDFLKARKREFFDNGFFVKKEFDDLKALIDHYLGEQGYLRARVASLTFKESRKDFIDVNYEIDCGQQTVIRSINISGNSLFRTDELLSKIGTKQGAPLRIDQLNENINALFDIYREKGYHEFGINKERIITYSDDYRFADINLDIYEGRKYKIGRTYINGLKKTKDRVVTREFKFKRGEKIDSRELQETENDLASLGVFGGVSVSLLPAGVEGPGYKDVLVKVQEKKAGVYEIGVGYRTDDGVRLSSGISYNNLGGWNRRIYADAALSRRLDNQFKFLVYDINTGYYEPYLFNLPLDFRFNVEYKKEDMIDYGQRKLDLALYLEKTFGKHSLILRNAFERVTIFDSTDPADNGAYWKYSLRPIYRFDTRNSVFNPTRGVNFAVYGEWGHSFKSALLTDYVKFAERIRLYVPMFTNWTFVPTFDAGYIKGLKGDSVLLDERFKLGGSDNLRGYRENIINDLTPRISSQYYYLFSLEFRRKLFWKFIINAFHDIGDISSDDPTLNGPFASVGGGISLKLPVGAISLQYGYIYDWTKRLPADRVGRLHFSIGTF
ncbi:MAG: POTRA domain-containing protein [Pseudomonadota bacterium]